MSNKVIIGIVVVIVIAIGAIMFMDNQSEPITTDTTPDVSTTETEPVAEPVVETNTIVDIAVATPDLSTLVTVAAEAGLVEALAGPGPITVFAPTDDAFAAVPEAALADLLAPENIESLQLVLANHVVQGAVMASDLSDGMVLTTLAGEELTVAISTDGVVTVGGATVTTADVEADNGVVHIIDTVIVDPS